MARKKIKRKAGTVAVDLQIGVGTRGAKVLLEFNRDISWALIPPEAARDLARRMIDAANSCMN